MLRSKCHGFPFLRINTILYLISYISDIRYHKILIMDNDDGPQTVSVAFRSFFQCQADFRLQASVLNGSGKAEGEV